MSKSTDLVTLIKGFRLYCLAEGRRPSTIRWYMGKLQIFLKWLDSSDGPLDAQLLDVNHLRSFIVYLREVKAGANNPYKPSSSASLSSRTIQGYARTLRAFFSWCVRESYLAKSPAKLLGVPKAARTIVPTFTSDQIGRMFAAVDTSTPAGFRDLCVMITLLDTGVRLSELVNLQLSDLHLEKACFKVMGKGWKERMVPIGAKVQRALWKYIHVYRPEPIHPGVLNLFLTIRGRPLSPHTVYERIVLYGQRAHVVGVRCSPHTFRHTFSKSFLLNGGDMFSLQKILGHTSLAMVRMYVNLTDGDVQVQHRRYSPVDRMAIRLP